MRETKEGHCPLELKLSELARGARELHFGFTAAKRGFDRAFTKPRIAHAIEKFEKLGLVKISPSEAS